MRVKVLKKEIWWAGRTYYQGDTFEADDRDLSEINVRCALGEVEKIDDQAESKPVE
jgi:hypothetical protein